MKTADLISDIKVYTEQNKQMHSQRPALMERPTELSNGSRIFYSIMIQKIV